MMPEKVRRVEAAWRATSPPREWPPERCRQCPVLRSNLRQHFMHYEVDEHRRAAGCWILLRVSGVGDGSQVVSAILAVDDANKDELRDSPSSGKKSHVGHGRVELILVVGVEQHEHWKSTHGGCVAGRCGDV